MAQPAGTFSSYDAVGNREDLSDVIYDISPMDTFFLSNIGRETAEAVLHEWQTDDLGTPDANNAVIEGDDATTDAFNPTTRLGNVTQISDKVGRVTGTQEAVKKAGRESELDRQRVRAGKRLKRDMEVILLSNQAKVAGDDSTARRLASVLSWIKSNTSFGVGGANPAVSGVNARTDGTQRPFTETMFLDAHQLAWTQGGEPDTLLVGPWNKRTVSGFAGNATKYRDQDTRKVVTPIDVLVTDFGTVNAVASRWMRGRDALLLQMDMWKLAPLTGRNMVTINLAVTGDSKRFQILTEYTLVSANEKASAGIFDLSTS